MLIKKNHIKNSWKIFFLSEQIRYELLVSPFHRKTKTKIITFHLSQFGKEHWIVL